MIIITICIVLIAVALIMWAISVTIQIWTSFHCQDNEDLPELFENIAITALLAMIIIGIIAGCIFGIPELYFHT